jgi:hypothetical protein
MLPILTRRQHAILFNQPTTKIELPCAKLDSDSPIKSLGEAENSDVDAEFYEKPKISNKRELPVDYLYVRYRGDITLALCSNQNTVAKHEAAEILAYYLDVFPRYLSENYIGPDRKDFKDVFAPKFDRKKTIIWLHFQSFFKPSFRSGWCENRNFVLRGCGRFFSLSSKRFVKS